MNLFYYPVIFTQEDVGYSTSVPDLPGCFSQGESLPEAIAMTQEAIGLMLEDYADNDYPLPGSPAALHCEANSFVMMVEFDKLAYDKKYNNKAVKKTVSIPMWLNTLAEENHLNFSQILQDALKKRMAIM